MMGRLYPSGGMLSTEVLIWWYAVVVATGVCQLLLQTNVLFVALAQAIFLLLPWVFRTLEHSGSMVTLVFAAIFTKLFVVSQWVKIVLLQAADTNLDRPVETVLILLLSLLAFWAAALAARPLITKRGGLVRIPQDPDFLLRIAGVAVGLCVASILLRYQVGLSRVGNEEYTEGEGLVVVFYLGQMLPLAVAALSARAFILSDGRRYVDSLVVLVLLAGFLQGLWENQRWIMMGGFVALVATYFSYGGQLKVRHVLLVIAMAVPMQFVVFPLVDLQRSFRRDISAMEYASRTAKTFVDLLDTEESAREREELNNMYLSWDTRLYYGDPTGFFDRFSPNPLDETIHYFDLGGELGFDHLVNQLAYGVPNMLLRMVGIERQPRGGIVLETAIHGKSTNMNYGVMAEVFASVGYWYFFPVLTAIVFLYILGLHVVYGRFQYNYFAAFGFSTLYFNFAVADLGDVIPQVTIQGTLNVIVLAATAVVCGRLGPLRSEPRSEHDPAPAGRAVEDTGA